MSEHHRTRSLSDYFRGLCWLDIALTSGETDSIDKPSWVTKDYKELIKLGLELHGKRVADYLADSAGRAGSEK